MRIGQISPYGRNDPCFVVFGGEGLNLKPNTVVWKKIIEK